MTYNAEIVVKWFAEHGIFAMPEHRFDDGRKWRFDFIVGTFTKGDHILDSRVALEVEGGIYTGGRHTRPTGFVKDMEKYNRAAVLGWRVLRVAPTELCMQTTVDMVKEALAI